MNRYDWHLLLSDHLFSPYQSRETCMTQRRMLENSHPTLPPTGITLDMQQAAMTDLKSIPRQDT